MRFWALAVLIGVRVAGGGGACAHGPQDGRRTERRL